MSSVTIRGRFKQEPSLDAKTLTLDTMRPVGTAEAHQADRARDLQSIIEIMQAEVAKDGGTLSLVDADYATGVVRVELGGACGSCSLTGSTLEDGVKRILLQRLDWVTEVTWHIDESSDVQGSNGWTPKL